MGLMSEPNGANQSARVKILYRVLAVAMVMLALVFGCNLWVVVLSRPRVFTTMTDLPMRAVGLVLGTSRVTRGGYSNPHFASRMQAAAQLYRAGKVKKLLVSGDNHGQSYDEPTDMRNALVELGVPESAIVLDHAGFRTLDSVVRAKKVFGLEKLTVISERFHNYRALFIAQRYGIDAVGFCADDVALRYAAKVKVRECFARVKVVLDLYALRTQPHFLGRRLTV